MHVLDDMFFNLNFNDNKKKRDVTHLSFFFSLCFCLSHNTKTQFALFGQQSYLHVNHTQTYLLHRWRTDSPQFYQTHLILFWNLKFYCIETINSKFRSFWFGPANDWFRSMNIIITACRSTECSMILNR